MNSYSFREGIYFTTFIVGARFVTVLSAYTPLSEIVEEVLEKVGTNRLPFVMLNSVNVNVDEEVILSNELAEIVIGL